MSDTIGAVVEGKAIASVRFPVVLYERLVEVAAEEGLSMNGAVVVAVSAWLDTQEKEGTAK